MLRSLGSPVPGKGRKHGGWSRRPFRVIGLVQTRTPPQNSHISSPYSSQTNPTTFPSTSVSSQFSLVQTVLVPPMPTSLHSALLLLLCPEVPTPCSSLIQAVQCFPRSGSQLQPICSHSQLSTPFLLPCASCSDPLLCPNSRKPCWAVCFHRALLPPG